MSRGQILQHIFRGPVASWWVRIRTRFIVIVLIGGPSVMAHRCRIQCFEAWSNWGLKVRMSGYISPWAALILTISRNNWVKYPFNIKTFIILFIWFQRLQFLLHQISLHWSSVRRRHHKDVEEYVSDLISIWLTCLMRKKAISASVLKPVFSRSFLQALCARPRLTLVFPRCWSCSLFD